MQWCGGGRQEEDRLSQPSLESHTSQVGGVGVVGVGDLWCSGYKYKDVGGVPGTYPSV